MHFLQSKSTVYTKEQPLLSHFTLFTDDQPNTMTITITDGSTNHTVTGLEENTEYHFTVIAEADSSTDRGESNTITATTGNRCMIVNSFVLLMNELCSHSPFLSALPVTFLDSYLPFFC